MHVCPNHAESGASRIPRRGGHMACVVALLHDAGGRQASCDAGAVDSHGLSAKKSEEERVETNSGIAGMDMQQR